VWLPTRLLIVLKGPSNILPVLCHMMCRYGHYIVVTGWNFSSPNPKEHHWVVKDSLSGQGLGQYWKVGGLDDSDK
jgi:hypothetical protein